MTPKAIKNARDDEAVESGIIGDQNDVVGGGNNVVESSVIEAELASKGGSIADVRDGQATFEPTNHRAGIEAPNEHRQRTPSEVTARTPPHKASGLGRSSRT
jgi:hypothetical protein